jgi:16S rRNA C967 or C1407 C5-methylase (RsmB/RsmF family)/NOL1/NOP2/fmu family ribosome biogenesis protein
VKSLPEALIRSLQDTAGFDETAFRNVHSTGKQITSIRINPSRPPEIKNQKSGIPWTKFGYYLTERPSFTFDPLFHAGSYYVQEASSMFLEQALIQTVDLSKPVKVLDLCAAPGGKSTHIQSLISGDSLLVSNEVIRSRANVLKDNIIKWGCGNVMVTNNDPKDFAKLQNYFDVIVVDAPCSGSGLFRRDPEAIDEWSENNVQLCSQRQQRILADVWPALKKNGILIYSTCSYSKEEDEGIMDWLSGQAVCINKPLAAGEEAGIVLTISENGNRGCRFWPDKVEGEGFFLACFQKMEGGENAVVRIKDKPEAAGKKEIAFIEQWVNTAGLHFIRHENTVYAWPELLVNNMNYLLKQLRVIYSGILVGELMRDKLVPAHSLAMSRIMKDSVATIPLDNASAILYLQRKELALEGAPKGWQVVTFQGLPLGWVNVLPGRVNNYYPKELRILKEHE